MTSTYTTPTTLRERAVAAWEDEHDARAAQRRRERAEAERRLSEMFARACQDILGAAVTPRVEPTITSTQVRVSATVDGLWFGVRMSLHDVGVRWCEGGNLRSIAVEIPCTTCEGTRTERISSLADLGRALAAPCGECGAEQPS